MASRLRALAVLARQINLSSHLSVFASDGRSGVLGCLQQVRKISKSSAQLGVTELTMPSLSPTMTQGNIAQWNVKEGQAFSAGDLLAEVETDKATMGWESQDDGVMARIILPAGTKDIEVGTLVALTVEDESQLAQAQSYQPGSAPTPSSTPAGTETTNAAAASTSASYPAHVVWSMPALSPTMTQGNIAKWHKQVGDAVEAGDGLVDVETDKATMMWESVEEGYIAKILAPDGTQDIQVGEPVVVIVEDAGTVPSFENFTAADAGGGAAVSAAVPSAASAAPLAPSAEAPKPAVEKTAAPIATSGRVVSSPYARKLASEAGVSISTISGTGPAGRVIAADVQQAIASGGAVPIGATAVATSGEMHAAFTEEAVKQIQKITAKRLLESKSTVPHYYVSYECEVDAMLALRSKLNASLEKSGVKISVNDMVIKACAAALKDNPDVNSSWHGDFIRRYHNVDITVAVQTPAGLMVPVVRDADLKGLQTISREVKALATKAKEGKLKPSDYTGGTFAVSNMGMFGVSSFCPIINPPQAAILGVGNSQPKVLLSKDGTPKQVQVMTVTISCDHRVIDGAVAATWLQSFRKYVENPEMLLL